MWFCTLCAFRWTCRLKQNCWDFCVTIHSCVNRMRFVIRSPASGRHQPRKVSTVQSCRWTHHFAVCLPSVCSSRLSVLAVRLVRLNHRKRLRSTATHAAGVAFIPHKEFHSPRPTVNFDAYWRRAYRAFGAGGGDSDERKVLCARVFVPLSVCLPMWRRIELCTRCKQPLNMAARWRRRPSFALSWACTR